MTRRKIKYLEKQDIKVGIKEGKQTRMQTGTSQQKDNKKQQKTIKIRRRAMMWRKRKRLRE